MIQMDSALMGLVILREAFAVIFYEVQKTNRATAGQLHSAGDGSFAREHLRPEMEVDSCIYRPLGCLARDISIADLLSFKVSRKRGTAFFGR
jgi:hypothetical protein